MNKYSIEERIFLVKSFYKSDENVTLTLRKWSSHYKNRSKPSPNTVEKLVEKFNKTGSVADDVEWRKNKTRSARTPELVESARQIAQEELSISTRRLSQRLGVSTTTAWKVLHEDLECFPYKIQVAQQLTGAAIEKRLDFAGEMCQLIDERAININKIIFTDEAHFWLDGYVNRQNFRVWGTEKPELLRTKPLHPQKLTVWCGLTSAGIIGPFFIEYSITSEVYHELLDNEILPEIRDRGWIDEYHFQHDGAPPHTTRLNLGLLRDNFGSRVIARSFPEMFGEGLAWPPYSPDLSPLDFFLWGYVKDKVYQSNPTTLGDLKEAISTIIDSVPNEILSRSIGSFERRLRMLTHTGGEHIENILH